MNGIPNTTTLAHLLWRYQFGSRKAQEKAKRTLKLISKPLFTFLEKQSLDESECDIDTLGKLRKRLHGLRLFLIAYGLRITHNIDEFNRLTLLDAKGEIKIAYMVNCSWNDEYIAILEAVTGNRQSEKNKLPRMIRI